jgi:hypothetical protein
MRWPSGSSSIATLLPRRVDGVCLHSLAGRGDTVLSGFGANAGHWVAAQDGPVLPVIRSMVWAG